ncbi:EpsG family protein [Acinetobacter baumannii]
MVYVSILFFITIYLYTVRNMVSPYLLKQLLVWIPSALVFFIPMAFQKNVGTDYISYIEIYKYPSLRWLYESKQEYLFLWIIDLAKFLGSPQFIFIIFSAIIAIFFFTMLHIYRKQLDYRPWLFFFIYFTSTGIYNTSFNTLRQSAIVAILPILLYLFYKKKNALFIIIVISLSFLHKSALFYLLFYPIYFIPNSRKIYFFVFCLSTIIYTLNFNFIATSLSQLPIFSSIFGNYAYYVNSDFFDGGPILSILTKLYYLPIFSIFWYLYLKDKNVNNFLDLSIKIWAITCFMIIQMIHIGIFYRFWNMFAFFYIFPIYYVVDHFIKRRNGLMVLGILLYLFLPYVVKVVLFPSAEYSYSFYNFLF